MKIEINDDGQVVVRILIIHEEVGMSAGSIDLDEDFMVFAPTREEIIEKLPAALRDYCGRDVPYRILTPKQDDAMSKH